MEEEKGGEIKRNKVSEIERKKECDVYMGHD